MARTKKPSTTKLTPGQEVHKIHAQLLPLKVAIGSLNLDPDNARDHNEQNIESIRTSLDEFGQRKCIVVKRSDMTIIAGNGTVTAAKQLGWTHVAALITDDDEVTATAFALADNRTGELGTWNYDRLVKSMSTLHKDGFDLVKLGWDATETRMLMQLDSSTFKDMQRLNVDATLNNSVVRELGDEKASTCEKNEQWFYVEFYKNEETFKRLLEKIRPYMRTEHEISSDFFEKMVDGFIADHGASIPPIVKEEPEPEEEVEAEAPVEKKKRKRLQIPPPPAPKKKCVKKGKSSGK